MLLVILIEVTIRMFIDKEEDNMSEQVKSLWLLECKEIGSRVGRLFTLYAMNKHEAETIAEGYLMLHPNLYYVSLIEKPHGFTIMHSRRPGHIVCKEA